jgi:FixJ family two-component response regulator
MTNGTPTVAVIDDDDSVRYSLQQLLRAADFDVLTFGSAEEFLGSGERERVDWLIVDVNLPGMSGAALVQRLSSTGSTTPAMLMTARDDPMTLELIRRAGPVPHLRKPFSDEDLFAVIDRALPG